MACICTLMYVLYIYVTYVCTYYIYVTLYVHICVCVYDLVSPGAGVGTTARDAVSRAVREQIRVAASRDGPPNGAARLLPQRKPSNRTAGKLW